MKTTNTFRNLFKPSDVRAHPLFYIEFIIAFGTAFAATLALLHGIDVQLPNGTSAILQLAGSFVGVFLLFGLAYIVSAMGLYGLFKGSFKWRARAMFGQFLIRLYTTIATLLIFGWYPTTWVSGAMFCMICATIYLVLKFKQRQPIESA